MAMMVEEKDDIHYEGNLTSRLMKYIMRYPKPMIFSLLLVLMVIGVELFRPTLIANAIDNHIEGYNIPYAVVQESEEATLFRETYLIKGGTSNQYAQLVLYNDVYYYFDDLTSNESQALYDISKKEFTPVNFNDKYIEIKDKNRKIEGNSLLSNKIINSLLNDIFNLCDISNIKIGK